MVCKSMLVRIFGLMFLMIMGLWLLAGTAPSHAASQPYIKEIEKSQHTMRASEDTYSDILSFSASKITRKKGFYTFYPYWEGSVKCKITKNYITVKTSKHKIKKLYGKNRFKSSRLNNGEGNLLTQSMKFKLGKKIYVWDTESPVHKVHKFGTTFNVTHAKTISKKKFYKNRKDYDEYICAFFVVRGGRVVGIGSSAGPID